MVVAIVEAMVAMFDGATSFVSRVFRGRGSTVGGN